MAKKFLLAIALISSIFACDEDKSNDKRSSSTKSIATNNLESVLSMSLKDSGISLADVGPIVKAFVEAAITEQTRLRLASTESNASEIGLNSLSAGYRAAVEFAINTGSMSVPGYASIATGLSEGTLAYWLMETGKAGIPDIKILLREMIRTVINIKASRPDISDNVLANALGKMNSAVRMASFDRNAIDDPALVIDATTVVAVELDASRDSGQINGSVYNSSIKNTANNGAISISSGMDLETLVKALLQTVSDATQNEAKDSTLMADVAAIAARAFTNTDNTVRSKMRETLWGVLNDLKTSGELSSEDFDSGMAHFDSEVTKPLDDSISGTGSGSGSASGSGSGTSTGTVSNLPSSISVVPVYATTNTAISNSFWNKFVDGAINSLDCDPTTSISCIHAGEFRKAELDGVSSCDNISASDSESAFSWKCVIENERAVVKSTGLAYRKGLRDLATVSGWKNLTLTVRLGTQSVSSTPAPWWTNTVNAFPSATDSITLSAYNVYIVGANIDWPSTSTISFAGNGIALVTAPNVTFLSRRDIYFQQSFVWFEIKYNYGASTLAHSVMSQNNGGYNTIYNSTFHNSEANVISSVSLTGNGNRFIDSAFTYADVPFPGGSCTPAGMGSLKMTGSRNLVKGARILRSCSGIVLSTGNRNRIINSQITQTRYGIYINGDATDSVVQNNEISGSVIAIENTPGGSVISGNFITSSISMGIYDYAGSGNETMGSSSVVGQNTILNQATGLVMGRTGSKSLQNFLAANDSYGISIDGNINSYLVQDTFGLADSGTTFGIYSSSNIPGAVITTSQFGRCSANVTGSWCNQTLTTSSISNVFMGRVTGGDSANAHNSDLQTGSGVMARANIVDWFNFSQPYRVFVNYGEYTLLSPEIRESCTATNCSLYDYRIKTGSTDILNTLSCPTSSVTLTHKFYRSTTTTNDDFEDTFLVRAQEFLLDGIGDDDGLCENNETCLRIKNYGSYQGHGNLIASSCPALTGAFSGVTLLEYATNGY